MARDTLMTQMRKARNLSLEAVASAVGTDQANLSRVEKGRQVPKRTLARRLFEFYGGTVPIAAIYDPEFHDLQNAS
jgi:transcriptional regulator with XRE-family HTH domain